MAKRVSLFDLWIRSGPDAVSAFKRTLNEQLSERGIQVGPWSGDSRHSPHLFELRTVPKPTVLYVKESSSTPAFWGLTKNHIVRLRGSEVRWFVVLLHSDTIGGYVLSDAEVLERIEDGTFELSGQGEYKVNEKSDLHDFKSLDACEVVIRRVL